MKFLKTPLTGAYIIEIEPIEDNRGLCPEGWNVPTEKEWLELINHLGGDKVAGSKMKDVNSNLWKLPNPTASNESGFSGVGWRTPNINGDPARYVAQIQISSALENSARTAAEEMTDIILDFFPDKNGEVKATGFYYTAIGIPK